MCGRYSLACRDEAELRQRLGFDAFSETGIQLQPRFNLAPGQRAPIVRLVGGRHQLSHGIWGFERDSGGLFINARSETAHHTNAFSEAFEKGRCLVPADGFFEWRREGGAKQPYWFSRGQGELLLMAGLAERGRYVVLTRSATGDVAAIHDRMPCVLSAEAGLAWLREGTLAPPAALDRRAVSKRVNRADIDDESCVAPAEQQAFDFD